MNHGASDITRSGEFRLLLADDHVLMRQILRAILETYPNLSIVGEAADGMEAVSMAAALKPDGIIMDVNMPKMDGIQAGCTNGGCFLRVNLGTLLRDS